MLSAQFQRAPSLNDEPLLFDALAELAADHLQGGKLCTPQYALNCANCVNPQCRSILNPAVGGEFHNLRQRAKQATA